MTEERTSEVIIDELLTHLEGAKVNAESQLTQHGAVAAPEASLLAGLMARLDALEQRNQELEETLTTLSSSVNNISAQRAVTTQRMGHLRRVFEKGGVDTLRLPKQRQGGHAAAATPPAPHVVDIGQRAASLQGALGLNAGFKSGWLYKEGRVRKAPKRRWFVLRGDKLMYFGGPDSPIDKPKGQIMLESCAVETTKHELKINSNYTAHECLVLLTHDRKLYFVAEEEEETNEWKVAIATSIICCSYVRKARIQKQETDKRVMDFFNTPKASQLVIVDQQCKGNIMDAYAALSQSFALHRYLTTLRVRHVKLGDLEMNVLADGLVANQSLKILDVSRNELGPQGARDIARILGEGGNTTLEEINVQHNHIGSEGVEYIAASLGHHRSLSRLFLQYNDITDAGAIALANALCSKSQYENWHCMPSLELSHNNIGCEGAAALSAIISVNPNIQTVRLSHNAIGDSGCQSLSTALAANKSVEEVELLCNPNIGIKGSQALIATLASNTTLTAIDVSPTLTLQSSGLAAVRALWLTQSISPADP